MAAKIMKIATAIACFLTVAIANPLGHPVTLETRTALDSGIANIHVRTEVPLSGSVQITYGSCDSRSPEHSDHQVVTDVKASNSFRLLWRIPDEATESGCLSAWDVSTGVLLGRSEAVTIAKSRKRKLMRKDDTVSIAMNNASGFDVEGPWFDGVAYLEGKNMSEIDVQNAKGKKIGIIGGGMSGLMTGLLLDSVGFHDYEIIEASERVGGRVRTVYLEGGPEDYQYQEMGPMRFPERIRYATTNETLEINDHRIVFQLAETLNILNKNDPSVAVNFIPWIQQSPNLPYYFNGIRKPDGSVPTVTEVAQNSNYTLQTPANPQLEEAEAKLEEVFYNPQTLASMAQNVYRAHKQFLDEGWDHWSEFAYLHNMLGYDLNITDLAGGGFTSFWVSMYDNVYFSATTWSTIDKGLNRLPNAFVPLIGDRIHFGRRVERIDYLGDKGKVKVSWRHNFKDKELQKQEFDYVFVTAPFTQVRRWRLPTFSSVLTRAINRLAYTNACKVALQFSTRFWEQLENPIFGGCTTTDIPSVGSICYPSYQLNRTGPGVLLASYISGDWGQRLAGLSEEEHVHYVLSAIAEIHGEEILQLYTGRYDRQCWILDENIAASWAAPTIGQHELYIPSYFQTENNVIFIGEHTSYTHAWIASALESAVRGTTQLLLELGLVDEAKNITKTWMGRWMTV